MVWPASLWTALTLISTLPESATGRDPVPGADAWLTPAHTMATNMTRAAERLTISQL